MLARLRRRAIGLIELLMDAVDAVTRSRIMRSVPRKDTAPEVRLRKSLHRLGLRYRTHIDSLPGSPDIVFPKAKVAIFVHGCYWHRHEGCRLATTPGSNVDFWMDKFRANVVRDKRASRRLRAAGWSVMTVWQCKIKRSPEDAACRIAARVRARLPC